MNVSSTFGRLCVVPLCGAALVGGAAWLAILAPARAADPPAKQEGKQYLEPLKDPRTRAGAKPELELSRESGAETDPILRIWADYPSTRGSLGRLMGNRRDPAYRDPEGKVVALEVLKNGDVLFGPNVGIARRSDRHPSDPRLETDPQHTAPIDFYWDARDRKLHVRSILLTENGDPADLAFRRAGDETYPYGPPMAVRKGMNLGTMYWMGWGADDFGFNNRVAQIYAKAAEDISDKGSGGTLHFSTTPVGSTGRPIDRIVIDSDGDVGVGIAAPRAKLHVAGVTSTADSSVGAGLAEDYPAREPLEPGDVVAVDDAAGTLSVKRSGVPYDAKLVGVVAAHPAVRISHLAPATSAEAADAAVAEGYPVAHAGRATVKVNTENGAIRAGDYLTSSSTPGVAMKATRKGDVLGKALQSFNNAGAGQVEALIGVTWYDP